VGNFCADHATPSIGKKMALTSPTRGGRSARIVRSETKATEFFLLFNCIFGKVLAPGSKHIPVMSVVVFTW
jgi:hypothetical protein